MTEFYNPVPIAVLLVAVQIPDKEELGLLVGRRTIEPSKGTWGLPGGYMEARPAETVEGAMARELREETGIDLPADSIQLTHSEIGDEKQVLIFGLYMRIIPWQFCMDQFKACAECDDIRWVTQKDLENMRLSFNTHHRAAEMFFSSEIGRRVKNLVG